MLNTKLRENKGFFSFPYFDLAHAKYMASELGLKGAMSRKLHLEKLGQFLQVCYS